ncbi:pseudouridine synthase [Flavobacterium silvisoli]|uniref:Pseudouridine synthase n=1 Tax=Flavobacterium silvisoli TaxID=2529433 RepID=A0A4Q9YQN3_9FLAO|nr:pseudouridine synthase [Flavobacterium silvisoli]TBX65784.1 pseudouridine synthase [Flavobacterium silvisoli]
MKETHRHFLLHKPHGYLSQFVYEKKRHKKLLGELYNFPKGTMAIGRLDEDSEGLLLLTTDGMMSEKVRSKTVEKEYYAQVDGLISQEAIEQLKQGVEIGFKGIRYTTKKCEAHIVTELPKYIGEGRRIRNERHGPTSWISVTVTEGKFRQVRKMTAAVGFPTLRLIRIRVGTLSLQLKAGQVIEVDNFDTLSF